MSQGQASIGASGSSETDAAILGAGSGLDDLLDQIDTVLEEDAQTFVASFVQKGGQ